MLLILQQFGVNCWNKQVVVSLKLETQKIGGTFRTSTDSAFEKVLKHKFNNRTVARLDNMSHCARSRGKNCPMYTLCNVDHSKRWLPSQGTEWPPFARFTINMKTVVFEQISNLICFSCLPLAKQASPSSVTRASPSPRLLG